MGAETTVGLDDEQLKIVKAAQDKMENELGVKVSQKDTVAKLARDYVEGEAA